MSLLSRLSSSPIVPDHIPKAPKFRRGSGIKDKWRESWTGTKTLSKSNMEDENRLLRWFSLRKNHGGSTTTVDGGTTGHGGLPGNPANNRNSTLPLLSEEDLKRLSFLEDEEGYWPRRTVLPPTLPVPPPELSPEQITRRHIVAAIVHSENNYVSALQRLVNVSLRFTLSNESPLYRLVALVSSVMSDRLFIISDCDCSLPKLPCS